MSDNSSDELVQAYQQAKRTRKAKQESKTESAEQRAARLQGVKQEILIERAQRDPGGYTFDGKYRDLDEITDAEAEAWLKAREKRKQAEAEQQL